MKCSLSGELNVFLCSGCRDMKLNVFRYQGGSGFGSHTIVDVNANVQVMRDNGSWDFQKSRLMAYDLNKW